MLKIVKDNVKSLHEKSLPVALPITDAQKKTLDEMLEYLKDSQDPAFHEKNPKLREGVGLAAPQIGLNIRMLAIYYPDTEDEKKTIAYELVNPRIVSNSVRLVYLESGEGCLSVDDPHPGNVFRSFRVIVEAYDALSGENVAIKARGFDAIVLQHEIDHLDGILFYDRIDPKAPDKVIEGALAV